MFERQFKGYTRWKMILAETLRALFRLVSALSGAALVMLAWSEFVFFNEGPAEKLTLALEERPDQMLGVISGMAGFYLIPSAFLVGLVGLFGSRGSARVLLIGALTGYSIEGAVVPAVYEAVPFSYLWTSIAWHAPITVALGVFILPKLLTKLSVASRLLLLTLLGVFWAIWTTWIWVDDGFVPISALAFAKYACATTAIMAIGYGLLHLSGWPEKVAPAWVSYALIGPNVLLFAIQGITAPVSAIGLLIILSSLLFALRMLGRALADERTAKAPSFLSLAMLPASSSLVYLYLLDFGPSFPSEDLIFLTFVIGMLLWLIGIARGFKAR
ncbi:MAG: hypothetical protein AAF700_10045 [Pseudomonadota bacterium]